GRVAPERRFSPREREVLDLVVQGYDTVNISTTLGIADGTTRHHIKRIYRKLGLHNRVELARWAWGQSSTSVQDKP
ncbi:MAG: helix-turn-helix domain-containing protein, partial [Myxococcota bacterium]